MRGLGSVAGAGWAAKPIGHASDRLAKPNLKTRVHLRDHGVRPFIELEPTDHPLAVEQRNGISAERVAEIYAMMVHDTED